MGDFILLRYKTLLGIGIMVIFMIFAITGVSHFVVGDSYIELEQQQAFKDANWMRCAIESDLNSLVRVNLDHAWWDDTYDFMISHNEEYIRSNLVPGTFEVYHLDFIVYLDSSGDIVYSSAYDEKKKELVPLQGSLMSLLSDPNCLTTPDATGGCTSGLVSLPEGPVLISSSEIIKSDGTGQSRGALIMGRYLDSAEMEYISKGSDIPVVLLPPDDPQLPPEIWAESPSEVFIDTVNDSIISGYYLITDVFGEPAIAGRTTTPRSITKYGQETLFYSIALVLIISSVFGFALIVFLDRTVLWRISNLCREVEAIGVRKDFSSRLVTGGNDEISLLSDSINSMLQQLEKTHEEVMMHEARDSAILKAVPAMILQMDIDGTVRHRNYPKNGDLSVLSSVDVNNIYDILPEDVAKLARRRLNDLSLYNDSGVVEYNFTLGDRKLSFESRIQLFGDGGAIAVITDNSRCKAAQDALVQAKLEAEAANRTKSEFLANMSHELRTPLNSVIGFSEIMLMGTNGELNEKQKRYVNNIHDSGKNLLEIVNDILDISKVEAGKMEVSYEKVVVSEVLSYVRNLMVPLADKKNISVNMVADMGDFYINADRGKLVQILNNLMSNAVKFTPDGGNITLGARVSREYVDLFVKDTGIGISEDNMSRLFAPFVQVDSSISRMAEGTGLGLALVKKLAELHGGYVQLKSKEGVGSTFIVSLPFERNI